LIDIEITASVNRFPLAVPKPDPPRFFYWRKITETVSDNLWVSQVLSSFLLVDGGKLTTNVVLKRYGRKEVTVVDSVVSSDRYQEQGTKVSYNSWWPVSTD
jgi:hypothetical protein